MKNYLAILAGCFVVSVLGFHIASMLIHSWGGRGIMVLIAIWLSIVVTVIAKLIIRGEVFEAKLSQQASGKAAPPAQEQCT